MSSARSDRAKALGATTIALTCNPDSAIAAMADIALSPVVGPEVLTGSTRLKSGTAQKLVLNMLTTASMIRIGKTYKNLMVDLIASNDKLLARAVRIVMQATECSEDVAERALESTGNDVKLAILVILTGSSVADARSALTESAGFLRRAIGEARRMSAPTKPISSNRFAASGVAAPMVRNRAPSRRNRRHIFQTNGEETDALDHLEEDPWPVSLLRPR